MRNFSLLLFLAAGALPLAAAATLSQQIDPPEANVGDPVTVTFSLQNGGEMDCPLPRVNGLQVVQNSESNITMNDNGTFTSTLSKTFILVPVRAGDFTIPSFDVRTGDGQVLHTRAMKLHVVTSGAAQNSRPAQANPFGNSFPNPFSGPVVMPPPRQPANVLTPSSPADNESEENIKPPLDADGQPAKVFMVITPKTTEAWVGETVPLRIEFFIRMDSIAQQDSLPTIKGSDFLMNDLSVRPSEDVLALMGQPYHRETWLTAISAPKSGDFPLEMERDTYWTKSPQGIFSDALGNIFGGRGNLLHKSIASNNLVFHVHSLPAEGRPADFTGAIGQFKVTGNASPTTVNVDDPTYLDFEISGEGNFDSVHSPALAPDPAWKSYAASSQMHYADESHTQGNKSFHQAIIPRQNGARPLPAATFSYFDPSTKKYVTIPIQLPLITVTGTAQPVAAAGPVAPGDSAEAAGPAARPASELAPNRVEAGATRFAIEPIYRRAWFWISQGFLGFLAILAVLGFYGTRRRPDAGRMEAALRRRSLGELEEAMSAAVRDADSPGFFLAARGAVQLHWGAVLGLAPERIGAGEIAAREPELAEAAEKLFRQADEVMYSGQGPSAIDLAEWERHVREDFLQAVATR